MLSKFLYIYWPFGYHLLYCFFSSFAYFLLGCLSFSCWFVGVLYISGNNSCVTLQRYFPRCGLSFFGWKEVLNWVQFNIFFSICTLCPFKKSLLHPSSWRYCSVFFQKFDSFTLRLRSVPTQINFSIWCA